jgi:hypothetical protein
VAIESQVIAATTLDRISKTPRELELIYRSGPHGFFLDLAAIPVSDF